MSQLQAQLENFRGAFVVHQLCRNLATPFKPQLLRANAKSHLLAFAVVFFHPFEHPTSSAADSLKQTRAGFPSSNLKVKVLLYQKNRLSGMKSMSIVDVRLAKSHTKNHLQDHPQMAEAWQGIWSTQPYHAPGEYVTETICGDSAAAIVP